MDQETKDYFRQQIEELGGMIARGFEHVEGEIQELRTDVTGLKTDANLLKTDVTQLKTDVQELRQDLHSVKLTVERIDRRTQNQIDAVYEDMAVLKTGTKEAQQDIVHLKAQAGLTA